mmetsp:Transcript_31481/g.83938  ORF Transcript_31481/g.83938 Transcript_31481/m.83938 type:complete len:205 (+) Transcript_31481:575-1189(+)
MFVAITPVGPFLCQPDTKRAAEDGEIPGCSTSPALWFTRPCPFKGRPSNCVSWNPTLRTMRPHGSVSETVGANLEATCLPTSPLSSLRSKRMPATLPAPVSRISEGDNRKRSQMTRFDVDARSAKFSAILSKIGTDRFFARSFANSCKLAALRQSSNSTGSTTGRTSVKVVSSRNSLFVNAACTNPRRPTTCTVCKPRCCQMPI